MSLTRLMIAVRDILRTELASPNSPAFLSHDIQIRPDGQPPATCGNWFISIYGSGLNQQAPNDDMNMGVGEEYEITCAITRRASPIPFDRLGEEAYIKTLTGMEDLCHKIIGIVAGENRYTDVTEVANDMILDDIEGDPVIGSSKDVYEANVYASNMYAAGVYRGTSTSATVDSSGVDYIIEPLRWIYTTAMPIQVDESWFVPIQDQYIRKRNLPDYNDHIAGLVMNVVFGRAFRPQATSRWT